MAIKQRFIGIGIVVVIAVGAFLWSQFRPELLFVNTTVNEAPPAAALSAPTAAPAVNEPAMQPTTAASIAETAPAAQPTTAPSTAAAPTVAPALSTGWTATFQSLAHETTGTASVQTLEDNSSVLRIENFSTSNGPDVRVYLVRSADGTQDETITNGDFIDLGALKGNIGNQNYLIPPEIDLSQYQSVSIWCRRFSVNFGGTVLSAGS